MYKTNGFIILMIDRFRNEDQNQFGALVDTGQEHAVHQG